MMNRVNLFMLAAVGVIFAGCASVQLKQNTLAQGRTLTDMEYTMVLDNVAMFRQRPGALPWHLKFTQGSVAIQDNVGGSLNYSWGSGVSRMPGFSAQIGSVETWNVVPETNTNHLALLRKKYLERRQRDQSPAAMEANPFG